MDTYGHLNAGSTDVVTDALSAAFAAPTHPEPSNVRQMSG